MVEIDEQVNVAKPRRQTPPPRKRSHGPDSLGGTLAKIILLGITDAVAAFVLFQLALSGEWLIFGISLVTTLVINWIYLRRGGLPAKYLAPGVIFLMIFQVFVMIFSTYIAFTNYGDGHNSTKEDAIASIQLSASERVPDSPQFPTSVLEKDGSYFLLVTDPRGRGKARRHRQAAGNRHPHRQLPDRGRDGSRRVHDPGLRDAAPAPGRDHRPERPDQSDNPEDGSLRTADGSTAYVYTPKLEYDEAADTFTDTANRRGLLGQRHAAPSWRRTATSLTTGLAGRRRLGQLRRAFTDPSLPGPLVQRHHLDLRLRDPLGGHHLRARACSSRSCSTRADLAGQEDLPDPDDPARTRSRRSSPAWSGPGMLNQRVRLHQPGAAGRRRHPVADRPGLAKVSRARREPVARLPVHVPRLHRRAAVDARGHRRGRKDGRRRPPGASSGPSSCRCCWSRWRRC